MAEATSPKPPEKIVDLAMADLTLAPRKMKHGPCLASFLHESMDNVKREFRLSGNRICGYNFDKTKREVRLSTTDSDERITYDTTNDPDLFFTVKDWCLFYNYVWRDLKDGCDDPLFIGEWNGVTPGMRYRVLGITSTSMRMITFTYFAVNTPKVCLNAFGQYLKRITSNTIASNSCFDGKMYLR